jgi:hypothetical protein
MADSAFLSMRNNALLLFRRRSPEQQHIRRHLKESGIDLIWNSIRRIMVTQCRVTASLRRADGKTLHVRKATRAEPEQMAIYRALKVDPNTRRYQQNHCLKH